MTKKTAKECMAALWKLSTKDIPIWAETENIYVTDDELRSAINALLSDGESQALYFNQFKKAIISNDQAKFDKWFCYIFWRVHKYEMEE